MQTFAELTTTRVGGSAEKFLTANTTSEIENHARELVLEDTDWMVLGGGSNTIMRDEGYPGTVLLIRSEGITEIADETLPEGVVRVRVEAGNNWDALVNWSVEQGLSGLEALAGIPGLAGAAPIQNIGAYGAELKDVLLEIALFDTDTLETRTVTTPELGFGYRDSALKRQEITGVVTSIDLLLYRGKNMQDEAYGIVRYEQLARALGCEVGDERPIREIAQTVRALRASKGMLLDDIDTDTWSSGSFFVNPIVSQEFARTLPKGAPRFPIQKDDSKDFVIPLEEISRVETLPEIKDESGAVKLSAAWLIERSGIKKGFRLPGSRAQISSKHTLAITNSGGATAKEIAELARFVVSRVRAEYGVLLIPEPNLYGVSL